MTETDLTATQGRAELSGYARLMAFLEREKVPYRSIDHLPEGQTIRASLLRGHDPAAAAKCMVLTVTAPSRTRRHVLAVVPGDRRVDLDQVALACGGGRAELAERGLAEELAGSVSGTITPFSFHPELQLMADPALFDQDELYFNAARLDRSLVIRAADYRRLAAPQLAAISEQPR